MACWTRWGIHPAASLLRQGHAAVRQVTLLGQMRAMSSAITLEDLDREFRHSDMQADVGSEKDQRRRVENSVKSRPEAARTSRAKQVVHRTDLDPEATKRGIVQRLAIKEKLRRISEQAGTEPSSSKGERLSTDWSPHKRLSREAMEGVRLLHARDPTTYSTPVLSAHLKISPESVRRILKSKWRPNEEETQEMKERAERRRVKRIQWYREQKALELQRMSAG